MGDALRDLLTGLIRDIRLILVHPDLGNAAKLAAITDTVDLLAPPPGPAAHSAQDAASVVALLARNIGPATLLFEELAGERVRIELTGRTDRALTAAECHELRVDPGSGGHFRTGRLRTITSGLVAAEVTSLVIAHRIPASARRELGIPEAGHAAGPASDVPLGKALARLGVRREPLGAHLVRGGRGAGQAGAPGPRLSVESSARMWLGDVPVALATEQVTAEFCQRAGLRLAGGAQPAPLSL
jgi:hypothetical protein